MRNRPVLVGVTGGIGAGKSTICKIFEVLGCKTYYADDRAKWLMENNASLISGVKELFGDDAYFDGKLNRKKITEKAFNDSALLGRLNAIVHPVVKMDFEHWISINSKEKMLLKEAALLFETGSYKELDHCILVIAEENIRIERVVQRDSHRSMEAVRDIISKQMADEQKTPLADFLIHNNGRESSIAQVMKIYTQLT